MFFRRPRRNSGRCGPKRLLSGHPVSGVRGDPVNVSLLFVGVGFELCRYCRAWVSTHCSPTAQPLGSRLFALTTLALGGSAESLHVNMYYVPRYRKTTVFLASLHSETLLPLVVREPTGRRTA